MLINHFSTIFTGALFVLAVIAGIGPQNLNTISHGIKQNHSYIVATTCFFADSVLIIIGCLGLSITSSPTINLIINIIGALFIGFYLLKKCISLTKQKSYHINQVMLSRKQSILLALTLTWLNPLVFIDTIIIIGGTASHYTGSPLFDFLIGAIIGDFIWIFGLSYLSQKLANKLNHHKVWIALDIFTIMIMSWILYKTILIIGKP